MPENKVNTCFPDCCKDRRTICLAIQMSSTAARHYENVDYLGQISWSIVLSKEKKILRLQCIVFYFGTLFRNRSIDTLQTWSFLTGNKLCCLIFCRHCISTFWHHKHEFNGRLLCPVHYSVWRSWPLLTSVVFLVSRHILISIIVIPLEGNRNITCSTVCYYCFIATFEEIDFIIKALCHSFYRISWRC